MRRDVQIDSDGRTVWVNDADGCCIGRFGLMGIDIHHPMTEQLDAGSQCLLCTHGPTTATDWDAFVSGMRDLHGVEVADAHRPTRFRVDG